MGGGGGGGGNILTNNPISNMANNVGGWVGNRIGGNVGHGIGNAVSGGLGGGPLGIAGPGGGPGAMLSAGLSPFTDRPNPPGAPGVDSGVAGMHQAQLDQARNFRQNLGANENQAYDNFSKAQQGSMNRNISSLNSANSSRGLLYGGVNQGQQQQLRAQGQQQLATGRASINDQYNQAANQMDSAAVGSGVAIQQYQQGIQDQIYNQALMNMMNQNKAFGSLLGAAGTGAALAFA